VSRSIHQDNPSWLVGSNLRAIIDQKNIKFWFKITGIWPINPKAMGSKTRPLEVYITVANINNAINEKDYTTKEEAKNNQ
jgi:hypothetical protein